METKLIEVKSLIEQLNRKINNTGHSGKMDLIDADIIQDILKRVYVLIDEIKDNIRLQQHEPDRNHHDITTDIRVQEPVQPVSSFIDEVPVMTFPKVEVELDIQNEAPQQITTANPVNHENINRPEVYPPSPVIDIPEQRETQQPASPLNIPEQNEPVQNIPEQKEPVQHIPEQKEPVQHYTGQKEPVQPVLQVNPPEQKEETQSVFHDTYQHGMSASQQPNQTAHTMPDSIFSKPAANKQHASSNDLFGGQTIGDKLKSETPSLNDKITQGKSDQSLAHKMQLKPISDLKTAIGINEKFQFVNDLFEGRIELYNDAINRLNSCSSGVMAENYLRDLKSEHNWNEKAEAFDKLKSFITRRYI